MRSRPMPSARIEIDQGNLQAICTYSVQQFLDTIALQIDFRLARAGLRVGHERHDVAV